MDFLLILGGFALLLLGGDILVRGAGGIALLARVSPAVIGLTVVAAGTSMPEMVVSIQSALNGQPGIAVGNIVGSNIFNIAAILGIVALISPLRVEGDAVRLQWPAMMLATVLFFLLTRDTILDRIEGSAFIIGMVVFISYSIWVSRMNSKPETQHSAHDLPTIPLGKTAPVRLITHIGAVIAGIALLAVGAHVLVNGAVGVARIFNVSETVIGLTIVAAGTSMPELITSMVAAFRKRDDIAVGNIIGSNIFNVLAIGGVTSAISPIPISNEITDRDNLWMLALSLLLLPIIRSGMIISRNEAAMLLALFGIYLATLFI
ncbi:MAG: calcium/sodium antiporter [Deltaproteobacteria bacterium]|nr:calcium/sodium antiporter [Deltaproteobacteria bacterium]MBN2673872.1 calcium/sodium antiporter [Deltaproteobacteria bacterium]